MFSETVQIFNLALFREVIIPMCEAEQVAEREIQCSPKQSKALIWHLLREVIIPTCEAEQVAEHEIQCSPKQSKSLIWHLLREVIIPQKRASNACERARSAHPAIAGAFDDTMFSETVQIYDLASAS